MVEILPSILAADFARLGDQIAPLEAAGCRMLHVDVMDGHFVPNFTLGPPVIASLRKVTKMTLDVHLMISDPDRYAPIFIDAGGDARGSARCGGLRSGHERQPRLRRPEVHPQFASQGPPAGGAEKGTRI